MATSSTSQSTSAQIPQIPLFLTDIPRFSTQPITKIPQYVFENCNQVTVNSYDPESLAMFKRRVKTLTPAQLNAMCSGDKQKFERKGEELDWIHGLDTLETEFLGGKNPEQMLAEMLKVDTVMRMNGLLSRFSNKTPGELRKKDIIWRTHDFNVNETVAGALFDIEFQRQTGTTQHLYFTRTDNPIKECLIKRSWMTRKFDQFVRPGFEIQADEKTKKSIQDHWDELDLGKAVSIWGKEQGRTDDKLDLVQWFRSRHHYFPLVSTLRADLEKSLDEVREAKDMHPIERACKVWFDVVRIHISHEANKRTGKALASVMLLSHGYLPPKIGKEDEKEYLEVFKQAMNEKDGHLRLTRFGCEGNGENTPRIRRCLKRALFQPNIRTI